MPVLCGFPSQNKAYTGPQADNKNKDAVKTAKILSSCLACPNHPDKAIEFICVDNDVFCCSTCATVKH